MTLKARSQNLRSWVEVDSRALVHNAKVFRKVIRGQSNLMVVIKSNAYGHGLLWVAKILERQIDWLGVDDIDEALALRKAGIGLPVLVLGYTLPARFAEASKNNISITIASIETLRELKSKKFQVKSGSKNSNLKIHIKLETGLNRQGIAEEVLDATCQVLEKLGGRVILEGIYSHFAVAELANVKKYKDYCNRQMDKFDRMYDYLVSNLVPSTYKLKPIKHIAGTAATLLLPHSRYDMVRVGIGMYGLDPTSDTRRPLLSHQVTKELPGDLKSGLSWYSVIAQVKHVKKGERVGYNLTERLTCDSKLAIVPVGYWHGYPRSASGGSGDRLFGGLALVHGVKCPIVGKISMDMMTIDVTDVPKIKVGDIATLVGKSLSADLSAKTQVTAEEVAKRAGTINYELVTRINPILPRIYR